MQFADIKNDIAFRKIFGNENKTEILISFLNAVLALEGNKKITWVEVLNPYQLPQIAGLKSTILDVRARDKAGNSYIVEMQVADKKGFDKRITFYSSKSYASQINSGDEYYKLKPTIFIGILNFDYLENPNYLSRHAILDAKTYEQKLKDLEFYFIELLKFNKTEEELTTLVEKWVYFIKNAENLNVIPSDVNDEGLKHAYQEADRHTWTKKEVEEYEYARMRETDEVAEKILVEERAKMKEKFEIAKNAILEGSKNEFISKITGLTVEQVEQLRNPKEA
jgi:predicted transposase/invertase (TIGR01784 family)